MVNVVDHLVVQGMIAAGDGQWGLQGEFADVEREVPKDLRGMIQTQLDRLSPAERRVLAVASVAGVEFSVPVVATGLDESVDQVEACCARLTRRQQFLRQTGNSEWPDGTAAARYEFTHALYQDTLYQQVTVAQRRQLHQRIGERLEAGYSEAKANAQRHGTSSARPTAGSPRGLTRWIYKRLRRC